MKVNQVVCGDSFEVLKTFPDKFVNLIITSPPFFIHNMDYNQGGDHKSHNVIEEWEKYIEWLCNILYETKRVLTPSGKLVINIDDRNTSLKTVGKNVILPTHAHLIINLIKFGFDYKFCVNWKKIRASHASSGANRLLGSYGRFKSPGEIPVIGETELILGFRVPGKRTDITDERRKESAITPEDFKTFGMSVWDDIRPCQGKEKFGHPCPFPISLCDRIIKCLSFKSDLVVDIFGGVGNLAIAAKRLGRNYISIDLEQKFCDTAIERLNKEC